MRSIFNRRNIKYITVTLRTCPAIITWFGVFSFALLVFKLLCLNNIPAAFRGAREVGLAVEGILGANVAAYIFFLISFHLPQVIEKSNSAAAITKFADSIANGVTGFLQMISGSTGGGILDRQRVDYEQVKTLFAKVSPNDEAPMAASAMSPRLSWLGAMALHDEQCIDNISRIWRFARFLEPELVAMLNDIELSPHTAAMKDVRLYCLGNNAGVKNADLLVWANNYWESYVVARRLGEYSKQLRSVFLAD